MILEKIIDTGLKRKGLSWFNDGDLHLFLAGTGTPMSAKGRAGFCIAVIAGNNFYLVDAGPGSWKNISLQQLPTERLSGILLTHYHSDHISDLGEAMVQSRIGGRTVGPLPVYGPEGVDTIVKGFNRAYSLDSKYRTALHGEECLPSDAGLLKAHTYSFDKNLKSCIVLEKEELKITAFEVDHFPVEPACGYRFDYRGKSAVISGDTRKCENLLQYSIGTDLLIHEAAAKKTARKAAEYMIERGNKREGEMALRVTDFHSTAQEAVETAQKAQVKKLVLSHTAPSLSPSLPGLINRLIFLGSLRTGFNGPVIFGKDGMWFHL